MRMAGGTGNTVLPVPKMRISGRGEVSSNKDQTSLFHASQPLPLGMALIGSTGGGVQTNTLPSWKIQVGGTTRPSARLIPVGVTFTARIGKESSSRMFTSGL